MSPNKDKDPEASFAASPDNALSTQPMDRGPYDGVLLKQRYLVLRELGRGGIGIVYLARDENLNGRLVVVKVLLDSAAQNKRLVQKFQQEVEALTRLEHPGIVGIIDVGTTPDNKPFIIMQYIDGFSLRAVLRDEGEGGLDLARTASIMRQVGAALSVAHAKGILHRDLKPENIMLQRLTGNTEHVKLIDFGIAKIKDSIVAPSTATAVTVGTVLYMSPEQMAAQPLTTASDIYSLGVVAYEIVTGRRPFNPETVYQLVEMQRRGVSVKPQLLRPSLPAAAQVLILKALAFEPSQRQQDAQSFGEELARALAPDVTDKAGAGIQAKRTRAIGRKKPKPAVDVQQGGEEATILKPRRGGRKRISGRQADQAPNLVHVLFVDIVGSARLGSDEQFRLMEELKRIVTGTAEFRRAQKSKSLISLDTGDGMALAFFRDDYDAPVWCAREIALALKEHPDIRLRMGANTGPAFRRRGINGLINLSGDGINIAQRVMDCGDAGHILVSKTLADFLRHLKDWTNYFHDLGPCEVKHGEIVHLYNVFSSDFGNEVMPEKVRLHQTRAKNDLPSPRPEPSTSAVTGLWRVGGGGLDLLEALPPQESPNTWVQTLGISHFMDSHGQEGLMYAPAPLGEVAQNSIFVPIKLQILQRYIDEVRTCVEDLTRRALVGQSRDGRGIEIAARTLADHVLPQDGFARMLKPGLYPQLDLVQDAASEIPWEVLEERYLTCPRCQYQFSPYRGPEIPAPDCPRCGAQTSHSGGKLALTLHLSHLVRGVGKPVGEGRQFLFIEDPLGDLCRPDLDPQGLCAEHLVDLRRWLQEQGYKINLLQNRNATIKHVLNAIGDPTTVGIYYFGHGYFPRSGDEGCLLLADGPVYASQIAERGPSARFVLLNACEGAAQGRDWSLDKKARSVASAFARGGRGKVVIAPLWPVVNVQAAEMARDFFQQALQALPLIEALRLARLNSLQRYEAGEPHVTWMAYRYFGDPNRTLPIISEAPLAGEDAPAANRVFANEGLLDTELFAFEIDPVLFRAARRKVNQDRTHVTLTDLCAGLLRKGDLTRFILRKQQLDPDKLYQNLGGTVTGDAEKQPAP